MVDIDFQVEPPSMGIKNASRVNHESCHTYHAEPTPSNTADGSGGIVQRGQEILLELRILGRCSL